MSDADGEDRSHEARLADQGKTFSAVRVEVDVDLRLSVAHLTTILREPSKPSFLRSSIIEQMSVSLDYILWTGANKHPDSRRHNK